jgi:processive 1,2-diacylglycerol beta-glucosyltransferase
MEVVACNVPLIVTGNLPGQEEGNPGYLIKHNLGVVCKDTRRLKSIVKELLINNGSKLKQIKRSQKKFLNPNVAQEIVDFVLGIEAPGEIIIPDDNNSKFWDIGKKINISDKIKLDKIKLKRKIVLKRRRKI